MLASCYRLCGRAGEGWESTTTEPSISVRCGDELEEGLGETSSDKYDE